MRSIIQAMMRHTGALVLLLALFSATRGQAQSFTISLDTSSLAAMSGQTFTIDFQFIDGSIFGGDANNSATIDQFDFGGGGPIPGTESLSGGASGSLTSTVRIVDSDFFNEFTQDFVPGNLLQFRVTLTDNIGVGEDPTQGGTPDQFSFALLDNGAEISSDPSGALVGAGITPSGPVVTMSPPAAAYGPLPITVAPTPEPSGAVALVGGIGAGWLFYKRRVAGKSSRSVHSFQEPS
jgi:hypothetical protein